ncbi:MAG: hypothetical protein AAFU63_15605 [Pseudomonadota bacterium]
MAIIDDLADQLALKALALEAATDDPDIAKKVGDAIGDSSPTMQEAFSTALRIRRAHQRADKMIDDLMPEEVRALPSPSDS